MADKKTSIAGFFVFLSPGFIFVSCTLYYLGPGTNLCAGYHEMKFFNTNRAKNKGFTLVELIVVVAIIVIIASVVLASLGEARRKARDTARVQGVLQLQRALQIYFSTSGSFPAGDESALSAALTPIYIGSIPADPLGGSTAYQYQALTSPTLGGVCNSGNNCQSYHLGVTLEGGANLGNLNSDKDGENVAGPTNGTTLDGISTAANCGADAVATPTTDLCYDITP